MASKYHSKKRKNQTSYYLTLFAILFAGLYFSSRQYQFAVISVSLLLVIIFWLLFRMYTKKSKQNRYLKSSLYEIDHLSGVQFEEWLKAYFEKRGYSARLTAASGDYGADVIIKDKKTHECIAVQAKRYNKNIGIAAVQQVIGSKEYYHADKVAVATNRYFTPAAKKFAEANHVELWDRDYFWKR